MARKVLSVPIKAEGRDKGKTFVLREMPADQAERWFYRLVIALANAGAKVPDQVLFAGAAGFAEMLPTLRNSLAVGMRALQGLDYVTVAPLLDEMVPFITWQPPGSPGAMPPEQKLFPGETCQIEEVRTWLMLRFELIQLHVGFSLADAVLTTGSEDAPDQTSAS